jgi:chromate reductase, NAD(P)H dehydrogenase (quinone)
MADDAPVTILGIAGSLRQGSFNAALLRAAVELAPAGATIETASIRGIPLYDGDLEAASGVPETVEALKSRIVRADGLLLVTPEYNNSIPGVLKNAIDWLSRPGDDIPRVFGDLPVALIGASPGRGGTILSQAAWLPVLRTLRTRPWFGGRLQVAQAGQVFDADKKLVDARIRDELARFLDGFARFARDEARTPRPGRRS